MATGGPAPDEPPGGSAPPRNLSIDQHALVAEWGHKVDVFLDGEKLERVRAYDVDEGVVWRTKLGPEGRPFIEGRRVAEEMLTGKVEVRLK